MLIFSARAVVYVVGKSNYRPEVYENESFVVKWWYQNETTVVMTVIGSVFPFIFEIFGLIEKYHPRKTLRIQLARYSNVNLEFPVISFLQSAILLSCSPSFPPISSHQAPLKKTAGLTHFFWLGILFWRDILKGSLDKCENKTIVCLRFLCKWV